jgi:trehalose utilization protein
MSNRTRVLVWGEHRHERIEPHVAAIYPDGMHTTIAAGIVEHLGDRARVRTTTLDEPEHGLPDAVLDDLDVLVWWGHAAHGEVADEVVERVHRHVLSGLGLVVLHSGHWSKIFRALMGTTCTLRWRSARDRELVWTVDPTHPIAEGVPSPIVIDEQEMYGEFFDIPAPDELVFISSFTGGEVFRSGCTFRRGHGRSSTSRPETRTTRCTTTTTYAASSPTASPGRTPTGPGRCPRFCATRRVSSSPDTATPARSTKRAPMSAPTEPLRLIQVGAGAMGRVWLDVIARSVDTQLVGIVDLDLDAARRAVDAAGLLGRCERHHGGGAARPRRGRCRDHRDDRGRARRGQHGGPAERTAGAL